MSTLSPSPEPTPHVGHTHHTQFYFRDGTAVFQLICNDCPEGVLYKLHSGLLASRSTFFADLFSLPRGPQTSAAITSEGTVDENPIQLPYTISKQDFDSLLTYLYHGPSMYPMSEDFLVSVLRLSTFFDIADGMEYTIREFNRRGDQMHPAVEFELARCFRIDPWIGHAFGRLMELDILSLDTFQVSQIGHHGYFWLTQTKAKIQALRNNIAFHVPPLLNDGNCGTPATCMASWSREWQENVRQLIHHPDTPISCLDLLDQLRNTHIDGLCDACQDLTVTWIWGKSLLTQEERLVDDAIEALMALQTGAPIRASLSASIAAGRVVLDS
ncbi:hypothetical protein C8R43DRAFT_1136043 [Mycena crocata]|nr:hypothetical protein C8R43DRAFT_1136043 [Mycena crocata]